MNIKAKQDIKRKLRILNHAKENKEKNSFTSFFYSYQVHLAKGCGFG